MEDTMEQATMVVLESDEPVRYSRQDDGYTLEAYVMDAKDPVFHVLLRSCEFQKGRQPPTHNTAYLFAGKKVRVTVEVMDEDSSHNDRN